MRKDITVVAETRDSRGKNEARRLRVAGKIPAVLYGTGGSAIPLSVNPKDINKILHTKPGHNTIFDVAIQGGEQTPVMVVDWQHDPIKDNLLHIDLLRIDLSKRIFVSVPMHQTGEAYGVKTEGGMFEMVTREIQIECLPEDIPEQFVVDITEMKIGSNYRASQIPMVGSMKLISLPDLVICHVVSLRAEEVVAADGAAVAEPEVVKKGKKEEEGAAKPGAKAADPKAAAKPAAKAPAKKK
jgi:large subunit ribosomal protein L25